MFDFIGSNRMVFDAKGEDYRSIVAWPMIRNLHRNLGIPAESLIGV